MLKTWQIKELEGVSGWVDFVEIKSFSTSTDNKKQLIKMAKNGELRPKQGKHPLAQSLSSYTTRSSSNNHGYDLAFDETIRKIAPHWFPSTLKQLHKQQLLEIAKNGDDKPHHKTTLGRCMHQYIYQKNQYYDEEFSNKIRSLAPQWFENLADTKRQQLIDLAKTCDQRPTKNHPLGGFLVKMTNYRPNSRVKFDNDFNNLIRDLAPHWFGIVERNKEQLLQMAKNGDSRPKNPDVLNSRLVSYTTPNSCSYDSDFAVEIKTLRPDWFFYGKVSLKKEKLLERARNGGSKPSAIEHTLYKPFMNYTDVKHGMFDLVFCDQMRELAPDWFLNQSDIVNQNKIKIIEIAKSGGKRPLKPLGQLLTNYICSASECYDSEFTDNLKLLRPDWFISRAKIKKDKLLELARSGGSRPAQKTHELGSFLCSYTNPNKNTYDVEFDNEIRKLAPHWFKK